MRRASFAVIIAPPTAPVQLTAIFYNEQTLQEATYRSIEDIRGIGNNESLWIDVTGVSFRQITTAYLVFD